MKEKFNMNFYEQFEFGQNKINYFKSSKPKEFFDLLASEIVQKLKPVSVLDVGCASGYLVESLRKLGVEAFGVDVSPVAVERVPLKVASYCFVSSILTSLPKELPKKFDLVVCSGLFAHILPHNMLGVVSRICELANNVLVGFYFNNYFNFEFKKNVLSYLVSFFAQNGLFKDSFLFYKNEICVFQLFSKSVDLADVVVNYEQLIFDFEQKSLKLNTQNEKLQKKILNYADRFVTLKKITENYVDLKKESENLLIELNVLRSSYDRFRAVSESKFWKLTKPFRVMTDFFKLFVKNFVSVVFKSGFKKAFSKGVGEFNKGYNLNSYSLYFKQHKPDDYELKWQFKTKFKHNYLVSIVVPVYNVSTQFLNELINSVNAQTYTNWELCIADGSDVFNFKTRAMCEHCAQKNPRIKYVKLEKNLGIAQNTNEALKLAKGDFVALLDHDDLLSPTALFECMSVVEKQGADFVYTDEMVFKHTLDNVQFIHFKPDFSPDLLRSNNYICHLSLFSMRLAKEVGGFSSGFDGSQDYDIILKLTEKAKKIVHIPKVLYYWREHSASVAQNLENKPYCLAAARKALAAHIKRVGLKGEVIDSRYPSTYRINYFVSGKPKVSVLIVNKNSVADLKTCVDSILNLQSNVNFEIVIVENSSNEQTQDYYKVLEQRDSRIKIVNFESYGEFNYSRAVNFGALSATGDYLVLLHNDTKINTSNWLEQMLPYAQRKDVGAVGVKLLYFDDTIQSCGLFLSEKHVALNAFRFMHKNDGGYVCRASIVQNVSAVSGVCMMVSCKLWQQIGGFNEHLAFDFSDVDFCLKIRQMGLLVVCNPYVEVYHSENQARLQNRNRSLKIAQFETEKDYMLSKWCDVLKKGDPYFNVNLDNELCDFSIKKSKNLNSLRTRAVKN